MRLTVQDLSIQYRDRKIIRNLNMQFDAQQVTVISGRSGVGKTTLFNRVSLDMAPSSGRITIGKVPVDFRKKRQIRQLKRSSIGVLPQDGGIIKDWTVKQNLCLGAMPWRYNRQSMMAALVRVGLGESLLSKPASVLSGGEQRRVALARLLLLDRAIWVLDEPTAGLDKLSRERIISLLLEIRAEGKTIIVVSHDEEWQSVADKRLKLVENGKWINLNQEM
jgi:putative ABC transport system ATP-binding protein